MPLDERGLQVLAVTLDAGGSAAGRSNSFGHGEPFFQCLFYFPQILSVEPFGPADVLALGGGQLLAGFSLLQDASAVELGQRGEDGA